MDLIGVWVGECPWGLGKGARVSIGGALRRSIIESDLASW